MSRMKCGAHRAHLCDPIEFIGYPINESFPLNDVKIKGAKFMIFKQQSKGQRPWLPFQSRTWASQSLGNISLMPFFVHDSALGLGT